MVSRVVQEGENRLCRCVRDPSNRERVVGGGPLHDRVAGVSAGGHADAGARAAACTENARK